MATLVIPAANLKPSPGAIRIATAVGGGPTIAFETVVGGQLAYQHAGDNRYGLADNNGADAEMYTCVGMFENGAYAGQAVNIIQEDPLLEVAGASFGVGKLLAVGSTPGEMTEAADVTTGKKMHNVGMVVEATKIYFKLFPRMVAVP